LDSKAYISSGVLELYVLGALDHTEAAEVELNAKRYPEIREELDNIQHTLECYAQKHGVQPSPLIKANLFAEVEKRASVKDLVSVKAKTLEQPAKLMNWLAAASIIVAVISTAFSAYFYSKWKNTENALVSLREENQIFAQNANFKLDSNKHVIEEKANYFAFVTDTSTARITLKGLSISPSSIAIVFWNKQTKQVFIDIKSLPDPPEGMQYQLWALDNGTPVDAGVFEMVPSGEMQKLLPVQQAQAFAVTLEKMGGSSQPTLEMIHVLGAM
jgi:anti-sigma-K factor RskA